jgi:hypothetical protein
MKQNAMPYQGHGGQRMDSQKKIKEDMIMGTSISNDVTSAVSADYTQSATKSSTYGKTVGNPQLSDTAAKYYEQLKAKYSNYDFVLVSKDQKANAEANAASYANQSKTVVLIDEEKIEKMATDSEYRKKYENILSGAQSQLEQLVKSLGNTSNVKGYGIKVNDNGATSFFAAMDKNMSESSKAQQKRIEKKAAEKKEAKKKAEKEASEERLEKQREKNRTGRTDSSEDTEDTENVSDNEDVEVISASSIEELMKKIQDWNYAAMSDNVLTDEEKMIGGNIDYKG